MSELNPEVGDLWNLGRDMYITEMYDGSGIFQNTSTVAVCLIKDNYGFALEKYDVKFLQKYGAYLGKSKASIKDLFGVKKSYKNVTQTDLHNIDDIQFPPRHDKTAYELQIENNTLQAEINRLRKAIRLARDTAYQATQDCPRCGFIDDILTKALNGESEKQC